MKLHPEIVQYIDRLTHRLRTAEVPDSLDLTRIAGLRSPETNRLVESALEAGCHIESFDPLWVGSISGVALLRLRLRSSCDTDPDDVWILSRMYPPTVLKAARPWPECLTNFPAFLAIPEHAPPILRHMLPPYDAASAFNDRAQKLTEVWIESNGLQHLLHPPATYTYSPQSTAGQVILIIAPENDLHARLVRERLRRIGRECVIWDTAWFSWRSRLAWDLHQGMLILDGCAIPFSRIGSIWTRIRLRPVGAPEIDDSLVSKFCEFESDELLDGFLMTSGIPVVNPPGNERIANNKALQLRVAESVGLKTPRTLLSNDGAHLAAFAGNGQVVCKAICSEFPHALVTRSARSDEFTSPTAELAPTLLQELVEAVADIRVTIVGDECFAAELRRADTNTTVDWRGRSLCWSPHKLQMGEAECLLRLAKSLGLCLAAADLRLNSKGEYIFLEINSDPQFMFIEIQAGLPISEAIARYLAMLDGQGPSNLDDFLFRCPPGPSITSVESRVKA